MNETRATNAVNTTRDQSIGRAGADDDAGGGRPKAAKACVNCRKQKMKCIASNDGRSCRRCLRTGVPCIFVPRANAATLPEGLLAAAGAGASLDEHFKQDVLRRLRMLESAVATSGHRAVDRESDAVTSRFGSSVSSMRITVDPDPVDDSDDSSEETSPLPPAYAPLSALWDAVSVLRQTSPACVPRRIWKRTTIGDLWLAFHERMPGLHFMPRKQTFSVPQPLLLASILYCSSIRGPPAVAAELAPHYFVVLCNAIAQLSVPDSAIGRPHGQTGSENPGETTPSEEWAFQTVLGIVLAGLLAEGSEKVTGLWISIAYRLILEHCPTDQTYVASSGAGREWRKLFSGVQIVDLEHASLHLSCPVIPIESPLPTLNIGYRDQLYRLSRMMHTGLTHFTGRGLPTIWSVFTGGVNRGVQPAAAAFTAVDAAIIRDWAHQLDAWLVEFSNTPPDPSRSASAEQDRKLVFRQYVLHRLVVLSIYHPARGCDLWSNSITPQEQHELLPSARATLKLHLHDDSIWSNWDLVMITWAALIVIQGVEGGIGEADDLANIRIHLDMLKRMNEPKSKLCDRLVFRLEQSLQGVHTPDVNMAIPQQAFLPNGTDPENEGIQYSDWQIFDQASLRDIPFPPEWS